MIRGIVARIPIPRCRISGSGFTEAEAGKLDEHEFHSNLAAAGIVEKAAVQAAQLAESSVLAVWTIWKSKTISGFRGCTRAA